MLSKHEIRRRLLRGLPEADVLPTLVSQWFQSPQGEEVLTAERDAVRPVLEKLFGYHILQVGFSEEHSLIEDSPVGHKIIFSPEHRAGSKNAVADNEELPLLSDSIDIVVVHHALDFTTDSHRLLREVTRVLRPGGHLLILGFNPYSPWGLMKLLKRRIHIPWRGRFISKGRVADWLKLLDLHIDSVAYRLHFLPLKFSKLLKHAKTLEKLGCKVHSPLGGVYLIHSVKQVIPATPVLPRWRPLRARTSSVMPAAENIRAKLH
ncbi:MAG: SAM-dependent methyltransferase [SAR86 cluster bacterium]|uniref:SAM-dependent methyltransferase n=1 Tax=SAR86 cluster bacterium TaxID=2030880 RepID=A0A2A5BA05_9GAMM|nr:MAG: SAM-dependent methyltransferase [SAR86 cluster bacterium]